MSENKPNVGRGFKVVDESSRCHPNVDIKIPSRATTGSAGYDISTPISFTLKAWTVGDIISTDIQAYMESDEVLELYIRSGISIKNKIFLINSVGIIDSDFSGNISFRLINMSDTDYEFSAGDRIIQGVFKKFLLTDDDCVGYGSIRNGGVGSTGD